MKMCVSHWEKLRTAIRERGLEGEVAKSGEEAARDLAAGRADPLMGAYLGITHNAMGLAGLEVLAPNADGSERCPICFLVGQCPCGQTVCDFEKWIDKAADGQLASRTKARA